MTLERQIYEKIRGQCISDASAERAAALAAELAVEKFASDKSQFDVIEFTGTKFKAYPRGICTVCGKDRGPTIKCAGCGCVDPSTKALNTSGKRDE